MNINGLTLFVASAVNYQDIQQSTKRKRIKTQTFHSRFSKSFSFKSQKKAELREALLQFAKDKAANEPHKISIKHSSGRISMTIDGEKAGFYEYVLRFLPNIGIDAHKLGRLCSTSHNPSLQNREVFEQICQALGLSPDEFVVENQLQGRSKPK